MVPTNEQSLTDAALNARKAYEEEKLRKALKPTQKDGEPRGSGSDEEGETVTDIPAPDDDDRPVGATHFVK